MSHTPGPWRVDDGPASETWQVWRDGSPEWIADVWTNEADARLIAAAPDLLAALTGLSGLLADVESEPECDPEILRAIYAAREAIAKAEGRS